VRKSSNKSAFQNLSDTSLPENYENSIDVKEMFSTLWNGKWIILFFTMICSIGASIYAYKAQEWWSSKAVITLPQSQDYLEYQEQVKQFQVVFDLYNEDGTVQISEKLNSLISPKEMLNSFVTTFNSRENKKEFLEISDSFRKNVSSSNTNVTGGDVENLYYDWYEKIRSLPLDKKSSNIFRVSVQAKNKLDSYNILSDYILYTRNSTQRKLIKKLQAVISRKKSELMQQKSMLELRAKQYASLDIQRSEYALEIAKAAGVSKPQYLGLNDMFNISLGSEGIEAKIRVLKEIKDLAIIEPRIRQLDIKLSFILNKTIKDRIDISSFRFIEEPQASVSRDKPKNSILIIIIGTLFGGFLGVFFVILILAFKRIMS